MGRLSTSLVLMLALLAAVSCGDDRGSLYLAAKKGSLEEVRRFIADGVDINQQDSGGFTALHAAIMHQHREVARYLVEQGADVNVAAIYGVMPLHVAEDADTVHRLLEKGAHVDAWSNTRGTALHAAVNGNSEEAVGLLLEAGAPLDAGDAKGSTALHHAAGKGRSSVVALLIDAGANVDAVNDLKYTPLHWAAGNGHAGVVALLIDSGAARTLKSHNGATPSDMAIAKGHADIVRLLEMEGAGSS